MTINKKDKTDVLKLVQSADLPEALVKEVERFKQRNFFAFSTKQGREDKAYCPNCLKAFAIFKAREMKLGDKVVSELEDKIESDLGHNGYYQDGDKIVK